MTYLQKLSRRCSTLDIHTQTHAQESLQLPTQRFRLLQRRCSVGRNQIKRLQRLFIQIRWFILNHFNSHDTQRPDIHFRAILLLLDDFGSHPVWCTYHRCTLGFLICELGTETEIGCIKKSIRVKIPMEVTAYIYALILTRPCASRSTLSDLMSRWMICCS